jgi:hypothetical protein
MEISELTRRNIFDVLRMENVSWCGRLDDHEFLSRLYDLNSLPSYDPRYETAGRDIVQHRILNPRDWDDDWVYTDERFGLTNGDDEILLRFLCEMLHPIVRRDEAEVGKLQQWFNEALAIDGYEIVEKSRLSGRPVFAARRIGLRFQAHLRDVKAVFAGDSDYAMQQITRMEAAVETDPGLAIGTAKELIESVCKTILLDRSSLPVDEYDVPRLVKETAKSLALTPDHVPETAKGSDTIRRILGNLASIVQGLSELRNQYGTGHGRSAKTKGLSTRHAKLAVGAASTLAIFLIETNEVRPNTSGSK